MWKRGSLHGVPLIAQFGYAVGGVSRHLATDAVVCTASQCLDSWQRIQRNALDSRSSAVSALVSGRLRRMEIDMFGKHFGGLYSWSTMSSSFVSPSVASFSHCESFHCSCICMAQVPCLVTFCFVCASFHPHVIHVCLTADWHLDCTRDRPWEIFI